MARTQGIPTRSQVKIADTWDLSSLYGDETAWERDFKKYQKMADGFAKFRGKLGTSARQLAECIAYDSEVDQLGERLVGQRQFCHKLLLELAFRQK